MRRSLMLAAALALAGPAAAHDYILAPARPNKLVVVDLEKMAVEKVIEIDDAGPTPMVPMVAPGGRIAYATVNKSESLVKLDLMTGETLGRIDLSTPEERVKSLFGATLSPDGKTLAIYESPVRLAPTHFEVQPTRIALYDAETLALKTRFEAPRQVTLWPIRWTGPGFTAWAAPCMCWTPPPASRSRTSRSRAGSPTPMPSPTCWRSGASMKARA